MTYCRMTLHISKVDGCGDGNLLRPINNLLQGVLANRLGLKTLFLYKKIIYINLLTHLHTHTAHACFYASTRGRARGGCKPANRFLTPVYFWVLPKKIQKKAPLGTLANPCRLSFPPDFETNVTASMNNRPHVNNNPGGQR